jgi:hypothetical protein
MQQYFPITAGKWEILIKITDRAFIKTFVWANKMGQKIRSNYLRYSQPTTRAAG